jgi:hypothetical protein
MALTEKNFYQIEITENDILQIRKRTVIYRDGEVIADNFERQTRSPGSDVSDLPSRVKKVAQQVHTAESVARFRAANDLSTKTLQMEMAGDDDKAAAAAEVAKAKKALEDAETAYEAAQ